MKKALSVLLALCLLLSLGACGNDQKAVYEEFANKKESSEAPEEPEVELTGELRIGIKYELTSRIGLLYNINLIAAEFEALHPGVKVTVEGGISMEEARELDGNLYLATEMRYTQNRAVELMSGEAPDILYMQGLSVPRYSESGLLCDLYSFGDFDEAFPEDEYFTNILKAAETDKGLFAMPITASPSWRWINQEVAGLLDVDLKSMESINAQDIMDLFNAAVDGGLVADSFVVAEGMTPDSFFMEQYPDLLDEGAGKAYFNTEECLTLLEGIKGLRFPRTVAEIAYYHSDNGPPPVFDTTTWLEMSGGPEKTVLVNYSLGALKAEPVPTSTINGHRIITGTPYAITQSSKNKELAWEFLKFAVSFVNVDENGNAICTAGSFTEGEPVDKSEYYELRTNYTFLKRDTEQEALKLMMGKTYKDEIGAFVMDSYEKADTFYQYAPRLNDALTPVFIDYFDRNLLTTEQCAKQLQEKAEIYLNE